MGKRRKFAPEFKTKVALEALAGEHTLSRQDRKLEAESNVGSTTTTMIGLYRPKTPSFRWGRLIGFKDQTARMLETFD